MEETLEVTGERVTLEKSSQRNQEDHVARYEFAKSFVQGKTVLDIACGTGYGTKILRDAGATVVTGVDIDAEAIRYAKQNYAAEGIAYVCESAASISLPADHFDVIVSFETIEHLLDDDRKKYLAQLRSCLKKDGLLILSTPNKLITSPWSEKPLNPYHVLEYYKETLEEEMHNSGFVVNEWFGQRFVRKVFTKRPVYLLVRVLEKLSGRSFRIYDIADSAEVKPMVSNKEPRYFVVLSNK